MAQAELASMRMNTNTHARPSHHLQQEASDLPNPSRAPRVHLRAHFDCSAASRSKWQGNGRELAACLARSRKQSVMLHEQLPKQRPTWCIHSDTCGGCHRSWSPSAVKNRFQVTLHVTGTSRGVPTRMNTVVVPNKAFGVMLRQPSLAIRVCQPPSTRPVPTLLTI